MEFNRPWWSVQKGKIDNNHWAWTYQLIKHMFSTSQYYRSSMYFVVVSVVWMFNDSKSMWNGWKSPFFKPSFYLMLSHVHVWLKILEENPFHPHPSPIHTNSLDIHSIELYSETFILPLSLSMIAIGEFSGAYNLLIL